MALWPYRHDALALPGIHIDGIQHCQQQLSLLLERRRRPERWQVHDQLSGFLGGISLRHHQGFQFHLKELLLPVILIIWKEPIDVSVGHPSLLFLHSLSLLLDLAYRVLEIYDSKYFLKPL